MLAGPAQGLDRHSFVGLPLKEDIMRRFLCVGCAILALIAVSHSTKALAQDAKGKNCRMEQQCHWQNFKKICVWVKVCR
jgi:hypothetical protein